LRIFRLPFPPDDPVYGSEPQGKIDEPWIPLGRMDVWGERGLLLFPDSYFMRLRYNPFHAYTLDRVRGFVGSGASPANPGVVE
jgi:hypothetical protein